MEQKVVSCEWHAKFLNQNQTTVVVHRSAASPSPSLMLYPSPSTPLPIFSSGGTSLTGASFMARVPSGAILHRVKLHCVLSISLFPLSVAVSVSLSVCLSVCLSACLSVCLFVCLPVCLAPLPALSHTYCLPLSTRLLHLMLGRI